MGEFLLAWDKLYNLEVCFYLKEIMGWTSGLPEIMETPSAQWDKMTFFYFPELRQLDS